MEVVIMSCLMTLVILLIVLINFIVLTRLWYKMKSLHRNYQELIIQNAELRQQNARLFIEIDKMV